jgi:hypothetical protein
MCSKSSKARCGYGSFRQASLQQTTRHCQCCLVITGIVILVGIFITFIVLLNVLFLPNNTYPEQVKCDPLYTVSDHMSPRGWNSNDYLLGPLVESDVYYLMYGFQQHGLDSCGYRYITLDGAWWYQQYTLETEIDEYGRFMGRLDMYPSGLPNLSREMRQQNFRLGLWIPHGIPIVSVQQNTTIKGTTYNASEIVISCEDDVANTWGFTCLVDPQHPGTYAFYYSIFELYVLEWEIGLIKLDRIFGQPNQQDEINVILQVLQDIQERAEAANIDFVMSWSPGVNATLSQAQNLIDKSSSFMTAYRITDDMWDEWSEVERAFDAASTFQNVIEYSSSTNIYIDLDIVPFGYGFPISNFQNTYTMSLLSYNEQKIIMSLWTITRSMLFTGTRLPFDSKMLSLITNPDVLHIHAYSYATKLYTSISNSAVIWTALDTVESNIIYIAINNLQSSKIRESINLINIYKYQYQLNIQLKNKKLKYTIWDIWSQQPYIKNYYSDNIYYTIPSHSVLFLKIKWMR